MRMQKKLVLVLTAVMVLLAILGALLLKVGMTTPHPFKKVCYILCAAFVLVLVALLGYLLYLSRDKEPNYFLYQREAGKNIAPEELRFATVNEKMSMYISVNFENSEKLWLGNAWNAGDRFGANGEYRGLVAYKMLYDLAADDHADHWAYFAKASADTVVYLCEALTRSGDRNLAQKLMYIKQNFSTEITPLRSLILGNKKYLAGKMVTLVRRNIEWFYYT